LLARDDRDSMLSLKELRMRARQACDISGAGHNAYTEDRAALVDRLQQPLAAL